MAEILLLNLHPTPEDKLSENQSSGKRCRCEKKSAFPKRKRTLYH